MRVVDLAGAPDRPALVAAGRTISYSELAEHVDTEVAWVGASAVGRFALLADNGCPWAIADLALLEAGLPNVPLPGYFTPAQMRHVLTDAGLDAVLTDQPTAITGLELGFAAAGIAPGSGLTLLRRSLPVGQASLPPGTAKVTYTSGSTGEPRGVCLSAEALATVARSLAAATAGLGLDRHLCLLPLPTLLENVAGIYAALLSGASCELPSLADTGVSYGALRPQKLCAAISASCPASLILVPELLRVLIGARQQGWQAPDSLRFIAVGGAVVAPAMLHEATRLGLPVFEGYGLSECASVLCLNTPASSRVGTVGRPLPHVRLRVDGTGQLVAGNPGMLGYLGDVSTPPPAEIATGDLGAIDADGFVTVRGRQSTLLITSFGRNIAPEWIESELQREPEIAAALVFGEARPWLTALLCPVSAGITRSALNAAVARVNARLPDYARLGGFALAAEPFTFANGSLTANGRLRRRHIQRQHEKLLEGLYREPRAAEEIPA